MMRTVEILLVIVIITGAFVIASLFAVLPTPRQVSPINLRRLALTTLQALDTDNELSQTVFRASNDPAWSNLQIALSASLPPDIAYNLSVYEILGSTSQLYRLTNSLSNTQVSGLNTGASSYLVASSNVTFSFTPEKIGERGGGGTLYILNCSDANGWWITGYTPQTLAADVYSLLSPYFLATVMVQNTDQLGAILNGTKITAQAYENITSAVVVNTCGEAIPIPSGYYAGVGFQDNSYAKYCYILGQKVRQYNWTWVSIVGYPFYYVSNTGYFPNQQAWGIYGTIAVGPAGLNAFLQGLDNQQYLHDSTDIKKELDNPVYMSPEAQYYCNYYGIYPYYYQTSSRALPKWILDKYHLNVSTYIFNIVDDKYIPGAVYRHGTSGGFLALGLARTCDIRLAAIGLLTDYKPRLYRSEHAAAGTSRLVILQLGPMGGT